MNANKIILLDNNEMLKFVSFMSSKYQQKANDNKDKQKANNKQGGLIWTIKHLVYTNNQKNKYFQLIQN